MSDGGAVPPRVERQNVGLESENQAELGVVHKERPRSFDRARVVDVRTPLGIFIDSPSQSLLKRTFFRLFIGMKLQNIVIHLNRVHRFHGLGIE